MSGKMAIPCRGSTWLRSLVRPAAAAAVAISSRRLRPHFWCGRDAIALTVGLGVSVAELQPTAGELPHIRAAHTMRRWIRGPFDDRQSGQSVLSEHSLHCAHWRPLDTFGQRKEVDNDERRWSRGLGKSAAWFTVGTSVATRGSPVESSKCFGSRFQSWCDQKKGGTRASVSVPFLCRRRNSRGAEAHGCQRCSRT